eukprot:1362594-Rhodomonas_salina.1
MPGNDEGLEKLVELADKNPWQFTAHDRRGSVTTAMVQKSKPGVNSSLSDDAAATPFSVLTEHVVPPGWSRRGTRWLHDRSVDSVDESSRNDEIFLEKAKTHHCTTEACRAWAMGGHGWPGEAGGCRACEKGREGAGEGRRLRLWKLHHCDLQ